MKKTLNRKEFLVLGVGSAAATLVACAGDGEDTPIEGSGGNGNAAGGSNSGGASGAGGGASGGSSSGGAGSGGASSGGAGSGGAASGGGPGSGGESNAGGSPGAGGDGGGACSEVTAEDQNEFHQHAMTVAPADVEAGVDKTYTMGPAGQGDHTHMVTVTAANFATLKSEGMVTVTSATDSTMHQHDVLITCA